MKLKGKISNWSTGWKVVLWLGMIVLFFTLAMIVSAVWIGATGNQSATELKVLQLLQSLAVFLLPALLVVYLWSSQPTEWLHLNKGMSWKTGVLTPLLLIVAAPGINLLCHLNEQMSLPEWMADLEQIMKDMEAAAAELTELLATADNIPMLLFNILVMAVVPALSEEVCFRGTCQKLIGGNKHVAVWVTAILFSAIHFQFYGFIPRMLLGAMFGYLLLWSGSLYVPMLAHFTNNSIAVVCYYLAGKNVINSDFIEGFGTGDTTWVGILSLVLTIGMCYLIYKVCKKEESVAV